MLNCGSQTDKSVPLDDILRQRFANVRGEIRHHGPQNTPETATVQTDFGEQIAGRVERDNAPGVDEILIVVIQEAIVFRMYHLQITEIANFTAESDNLALPEYAIPIVGAVKPDAVQIARTIVEDQNISFALALFEASEFHLADDCRIGARFQISDSYDMTAIKIASGKII
jgi:hypothetical protein